jgi:hypothetical protein
MTKAVDATRRKAARARGDHGDDVKGVLPRAIVDCDVAAGRERTVRHRAQRAVRGELVAAQVDRAFRLVRIGARFERCLISSEKCRISSGITRPAVLAPVKFWIRHDIS